MKVFSPDLYLNSANLEYLRIDVILLSKIIQLHLITLNHRLLHDLEIIKDFLIFQNGNLIKNEKLHLPKGSESLAFLYMNRFI